MMRRSIYSSNPKHAPPLIEILWDRDMISADVKAGVFDIKAIGPLFNQALADIQAAILKGKANESKESDSQQAGAGAGAQAPGSEAQPGGDRKARKGKAPAHK